MGCPHNEITVFRAMGARGGAKLALAEARLVAIERFVAGEIAEDELLAAADDLASGSVNPARVRASFRRAAAAAEDAAAEEDDDGESDEDDAFGSMGGGSDDDLPRVPYWETGELAKLIAAQEAGTLQLPPEEPPSHMVCPIAGVLMLDPVVTADGSTYGRAAIAKWLLSSSRSPLTNERLTDKSLRPNSTLRSLVLAWLEGSGGGAAGDSGAAGAAGPSAAAGGGGASSWSCAVCTFDNAPRASLCVMCLIPRGTAAPEDGEGGAGGGSAGGAGGDAGGIACLALPWTSRIAYLAPPWTCSACTLINEPHAAACRACAAAPPLLAGSKRRREDASDGGGAAAASEGVAGGDAAGAGAAGDAGAAAVAGAAGAAGDAGAAPVE